MDTIQLIVQAPRTIRIHFCETAHPEAGRVLVKSRISGISPGTEMLFYRGEGPVDVPIDKAIPSGNGALAYPLHYGYAVAGRVVEVGEGVAPAWLQQRVFSFHPHASAFLAAPEELIAIPDAISDRDAILFANAETAVNLVQDGAPVIGERVLVLGLGVVGLLVASTLARIVGVEVTAIDPLANRREAAAKMGVPRIFAPDDHSLRDFDLVYELTGRPETLATAIDAAGYGGRVVVGSWYGAKQAQFSLNTHFHRERIRIISSQVSTIAPELSARWTKQRRYELVWRIMQMLPLTHLHTHTFPAEEAALAFDLVDKHPDQTIQVGLTYA